MHLSPPLEGQVKLWYLTLWILLAANLIFKESTFLFFFSFCNRLLWLYLGGEHWLLVSLVFSSFNEVSLSWLLNLVVVSNLAEIIVQINCLLHGKDRSQSPEVCSVWWDDNDGWDNDDNDDYDDELDQLLLILKVRYEWLLRQDWQDCIPDDVIDEIFQLFECCATSDDMMDCINSVFV